MGKTVFGNYEKFSEYIYPVMVCYVTNPNRITHSKAQHMC